MLKKFICIVLCICISILTLCSCGIESNTINITPVNAEESYIPSGTVATDGDLKLVWDAERCSLAVFRNENPIWASMPLEQYINNNANKKISEYIESHISVEYKDMNTNMIVSTISRIGALQNGRVYSYKVDDGIRILYCFDKECFAVPVIYRLVDGKLEVILDKANIYESGNEVYSVSILPYSSGVSNIAENEIFVPDGSGMILKCDSNRAVRKYSADVYGDDPVESTAYKFVYNETARLPVFAVKNSNYGTYCTIITDGEANAMINAAAGDEVMGYSYAYATFKIRGAESTEVQQVWGKVAIVSLYSGISKKGNMKLQISFLDNEDDNFVSVANCYRDYLIENKGLEKQKNDKAFYIDVPMALSQKEFVFGIPNNKTVAITTYEQVEKIISDLEKNTGILPIVRLSGIQSGGLEIGKIAGGFKTEGVLGNKKSLKSLLNTIKKSNSEIYPDFDITRFSQSGNGYSIKSDSAKTATTKSAIQYFYSLSSGTNNKNAYNYRLLSPKYLYSATEKLVDKIDNMGFENLSLSSFGKNAYSDYGYEEGYVGADFIYNAQKINTMLKKRKISVMYDAANQYAAVGANRIINAPLNTSEYNSQDEWLPFYQMVFKGYVAMASESVNLVNDSTNEVLRAIQSGTGLNFTVCGSNTSNYASSKFPQLVVGEYENSKENIISVVKNSSDAINAVSNATITEFVNITNGVYKTVFSNGVEITVNYNDTAYEDINAKSYKISSGGVK